jgi:hypothetical protein
MTKMWPTAPLDTQCEDEFNVYAGGAQVGRVYRTSHVSNGEAWCWFIQLKHHQPGVQYAGQAETLEDAMAAFETNYHRN